MAPALTTAAAAEATASSMSGALTQEQLDRFNEDGFLVIPNFFNPAPFLAQAQRLIRSFDPHHHPLTKFSTGGDKDDDAHVGDRYFLESGDKIRYFLEEDAVDSHGQLNRKPELCVNKCGHALHALDPVFHSLTFSDRVQGLVRSLNAFSSPLCLQSMVICKQPSIGGAVPAHNDSTFLYTSPPSATGLWFALEDCTLNNGCLSFMPGSHRWPAAGTTSEQLGVPRGVNKRFVRAQPRNPDAGTTFLTLSETEEMTWDEERAVTAECKAGTLVLIHGSVMHKSERNRSDHSRYIYTFHCIDGVAQYDEQNWLQPSVDMPFSRLYDPPLAPQ